MWKNKKINLTKLKFDDLKNSLLLKHKQLARNQYLKCLNKMLRAFIDTTLIYVMMAKKS